MLVNASLSSTYAPMLAETKRAGVPVLFMGAVCPKEVLPPNADPLQFCSTGFAQTYDSNAALAYVKSIAKGRVKVGYAAMAIPISRSEIDFAAAEAEKMGFKTVAKEVIPPPTPDYTPFATKIKDAGANWAFSWAPWVTEVRTFEALRRLDWQGEYLTIAHLEAEGELPRAEGSEILRDGRECVLLGRSADPQGDHRSREGRRRQISGQPDDRRLARRARARSGSAQGRLAGHVGEDRGRACPISRSTPRACAACRWCGPRTTTSAPSRPIASIAGTATRSSVQRDWLTYDVK